MQKSAEKCSRETWLEAALHTLKLSGIEAVRIEPIARELGVTKGSFYWHFDNRHDLLNQIFSYWSLQMNEQVFNYVSALAVSPGDKLEALLEQTIVCGRGRYDSAIRAWAKADGEIALRLRKIDRKRLDFIVELFKDAGFVDGEAQLRSQLLYGYMVGEADVSHLIKKRCRQESIKRIAGFIMSS